MLGGAGHGDIRFFAMFFPIQTWLVGVLGPGSNVLWTLILVEYPAIAVAGLLVRRRSTLIRIAQCYVFGSLLTLAVLALVEMMRT